MSAEFPPIRPDEDTDNDSAIGSYAETNTETLSSWIIQYRKENGRTYHAFEHEKYWGPNDEQAQDHLDLAHHLYTLTFEGKLYLAPISPNISNVLDIGTGTGIWALDFADGHPSAVVIGTDLSPIQPTWVPPNLKFEVDDCEADWTYPDNYFDYIHIRTLSGSIKDWNRLYTQAMRCLKPGGYIEHLELAPGSDEPGCTPRDEDNWAKEGLQIAQIIDRTYEIMYHMYDWIRDAGFQDVVERRYRWPLGLWAKDKKLKELGIWARAHVDAGLENWSLSPLTQVLGWSYDRVQAHIAKERKRLWDPKRRATHEMRVVYGMKPKEREEQRPGTVM